MPTSMSWGSTIGVAFLTGIAGAASAGYLTYLCVVWYRLQTHDGGDLGYYIIFIPLGLLGGFAIGAVLGRIIPGFWAAQGTSLALVLGLCAIFGLVARMYGEVAPELDGDRLLLQVELKCPRGWQPDYETQKPEGSSCRVQPVGPGLRMGPSMPGYVDWKKASQIDGHWVVPCEVSLFSSRETRLVDVYLGKTWVGFNLRLPPHPSNANKEWSQWISDGFSYETGKPPVTNYAYRCRVRRLSEIRDEAAGATNALWEEREKAADAIPAEAPVARWLPLFEDPDGTPAAYRWGGADRKERHAVAARVLELPLLLASSDRTVKRQAVFALGSLQETPEPLVAPLLDAGRLTIELIKEARTGDHPDLDAERRVLDYFGMWRNAMNNAGPEQAPRFRTVLLEVEHEASTSKSGDIEIIARESRESLEKLAPPAAH